MAIEDESTSLLPHSDDAERAARSETTPLINEIVERLKPLSLHRVILFGSHAWGEPEPDSDLDVLVVLNDSSLPETSQERGALHRRVSRKIREVMYRVPIDLIVHTRPMYRQFLEADSMFARKVKQQGRVVYEDGN